jgi:Spy/CpxP family protein refolding chaperone
LNGASHAVWQEANIMCHPILFGLLGGFAAAGLMRGLRRRGCAGGPGRWRRGPGLFWVMRELELDPRQRQELWGLFGELRRAVGELRWSGLEGLDAALDALGAETFDRARVDEMAAKQAGQVERVRQKLVEALERAHAILSPEQRAKLRDLVGLHRPAPAGPDGGPYRTAL